MEDKKALEVALSIMKQQKETPVLLDAIATIERLQKREWITKWSQETIVQALTDWANSHGRPPSVTNLIEPGMPGASVIQAHFGMRASALLTKLYPKRRQEQKNAYGFDSQQDWLNCFKEQYLKHSDKNGFNSNTYDSFRDPGTPLWATIARHCGVVRWTELLEIASIKPRKAHRNLQSKIRVTAVQSPWMDRFEAAVEQRKKLDDDLIRVISDSHHKKPKK